MINRKLVVIAFVITIIVVILGYYFGTDQFVGEVKDIVPCNDCIEKQKKQKEEEENNEDNSEQSEGN